VREKVPTFYIPQIIKIGKRNGRALKKRTKIKCPFLKSGNFSLRKNPRKSNCDATAAKMKNVHFFATA
jgi:hypothetical protein